MWVDRFKSKTNLVTFRKCNSHLQYYKIDLSFSILQKNKLETLSQHKTRASRSIIMIKLKGIPTNDFKNVWKEQPKYVTY